MCKQEVVVPQLALVGVAEECIKQQWMCVDDCDAFGSRQLSDGVREQLDSILGAMSLPVVAIDGFEDGGACTVQVVVVWGGYEGGGWCGAETGTDGGAEQVSRRVVPSVACGCI